MTVTIPERITPALLTQARQALEAHGLTVQKLKSSVTALGTDPDDAPAYTVRRGRQIVAENISARGLIDLAARAAGEVESD